MLPESPGLWEARRYPVTAGIAVAALLVSLADWAGIELPLFFDVRFALQPWRLVTSMLPHVNVLHLLFNFCWLWTFGTVLERSLGPWRYVALVAGLESVSAAAEYALVMGGIGLSGVVYGFLGFLWARRRDPRFQLLVQPATVWLFVVWFFLCLALTVAEIWPVANIAHAAGAATGLLLGALPADSAWRRRARMAAAAGVVAPRARRGHRPAPLREPDARPGGRSGRLRRLSAPCSPARTCRRRRCSGMAVRLDGRRTQDWFNLGIALSRLDLGSRPRARAGGPRRPRERARPAGGQRGGGAPPAARRAGYPTR